MCVSFAHGANDVANSIGPLAAIYSIWSTSSVETSSSVPLWILLLGGTGIVLGLATYGYKIIQAVGIKLTKISPARGFAVEMGVAIVIVFGSRYGINHVLSDLLVRTRKIQTPRNLYFVHALSVLMNIVASGHTTTLTLC